MDKTSPILDKLLQYINMARGKRYTSEKKLAVVKEMIKGAKTQEQICIKHGVSRSVTHKWMKQFNENGSMIFEIVSKKKQSEKESPEYLTGVIGKLTVENDILKKALGVWE